MKLVRNDYAKFLAIAVGGVLAGGAVACKQESTKGAQQAPAMAEKHICAGKNSCKNLGGCKTGDNGCAGKNSCKSKGGCATASERHDCGTKNSCKGLGGCKTGDNGCAGKNSCKGKGGCAVPVKHT